MERALASLLRRGMAGDREAMRAWLERRGALADDDRAAPPSRASASSPPDAPPPSVPQVQAPPPPAEPMAPRLSYEQAEKLATEEERQRKNWWLLQLPLDRHRITERALAILAQDAATANPRPTPGEVLEAYRAGRISRDRALKYLETPPGN